MEDIQKENITSEQCCSENCVPMQTNMDEVIKIAFANAISILPAEYEFYIKSETSVLFAKDMALEITNISRDIVGELSEKSDEEHRKISTKENSTKLYEETYMTHVEYLHKKEREEDPLTDKLKKGLREAQEKNISEINDGISSGVHISDSQAIVTRENVEIHDDIFEEIPNDAAVDLLNENIDAYSDCIVDSMCQGYECDISFLFEEQETFSPSSLSYEKAPCCKEQMHDRRPDENDHGLPINLIRSEDVQNPEDGEEIHHNLDISNDTEKLSTKPISYKEENAVYTSNVQSGRVLDSKDVIDRDKLLGNARMNIENVEKEDPSVLKRNTQRLNKQVTKSMKMIRSSMSKVYSSHNKTNKVKKKFIHITDKAKRGLLDTIPDTFKCKPKEIKHILKNRLNKRRLKLITNALCIETFTLKISPDVDKVLVAYFTRDGNEFLPPVQIKDLKSVQRVRNLQIISLVIEVLMMVLQQVGVRVILTGSVLLTLIELFMNKVCNLQQQIEDILQAFETNDDFQKAKTILSLVLECFNSKLIVDFMKILFKNLGQIALMAIIAETILKISVCIGTGAIAMVAQIMVILVPAANFKRKIHNLVRLRQIERETQEEA